MLNDPSGLPSHQRSRAADFESQYPLTVGRSYGVLGMSIWENVLEFLVRDDWGGPCFASAGFFEVTNAALPAGWHFALLPGVRARGEEFRSSPGVAVWGYRELVEDPMHAAALQEQNRDALYLFDRYCTALDEDEEPREGDTS